MPLYFGNTIIPPAQVKCVCLSVEPNPQMFPSLLCITVGAYPIFNKGKGKVAPFQAWSGQEGSRKISFPHFMTKAQVGGNVVNLTRRPPLPPGNAPGTHFC